MNDIRVCCICLVKDEEKYLKEWCDHYLNKYNFDHIFLIDNNKLDESKPNNGRLTLDDINKYHVKDITTYKNINSAFCIYDTNIYIDDLIEDKVTIIHYNDNSELLNFGRDYGYNVGQLQLQLYNNVIINDINCDNIKYNILDNYDYCFICDVDEFMEICNLNKENLSHDNNEMTFELPFNNIFTYNIKDFIEDYMLYNDYSSVSFPWLIYTDNNNLKDTINKSIPVQFRFKQPLYKEVTEKWNIRNGIYDENDKNVNYNHHNNWNSWDKVLFKTKNISSISTHEVFYNNETDNEKRFVCNEFKFKDFVEHGFYGKQFRYSYFLKHYKTKSVEEYVKHKILDLYTNKCIQCSEEGGPIKSYFVCNTITINKLLRFCSLFKKYNLHINDIDRKFILDCFNDPRFSPLTIGIRTNNRRMQLERNLKSIERQTMKANILISMDNCKDNTFEYLSNYVLDKNNPLQKYISIIYQQRPMGPGRNNDVILNSVQTRYFIGFDDDDEYEYEKWIETIYNAMIDNPDAYCYYINEKQIDSYCSWSWCFNVIDVELFKNIIGHILPEYVNDDWMYRALFHNTSKIVNNQNGNDKYNMYFKGNNVESRIDFPSKDIESTDNNKINVLKYNICGQLGDMPHKTYHFTWDLYEHACQYKFLNTDDKNKVDRYLNAVTKEEQYRYIRKNLNDIIAKQYDMVDNHFANTLRYDFMYLLMMLPIEERQEFIDRFDNF